MTITALPAPSQDDRPRHLSGWQPVQGGHKWAMARMLEALALRQVTGRDPDFRLDLTRFLPEKPFIPFSANTTQELGIIFHALALWFALSGFGWRRRPSAESRPAPPRAHLALAERCCWPGQTRNVDACSRSSKVCQRTKANLRDPIGLLHPRPLPTGSRRGGVIGVDWPAGLPMTASGFDRFRAHVDRPPSKVHAVPTASRTRRRRPSAWGRGVPAG